MGKAFIYRTSLSKLIRKKRYNEIYRYQFAAVSLVRLEKE